MLIVGIIIQASLNSTSTQHVLHFASWMDKQLKLYEIQTLTVKSNTE